MVVFRLMIYMIMVIIGLIENGLIDLLTFLISFVYHLDVHIMVHLSLSLSNSIITTKSSLRTRSSLLPTQIPHDSIRNVHRGDVM